MARHIKAKFQCPVLAELSRQLLFAPPAGRLRQIKRLEKLHDEIDPGQEYPAEFLTYRITGYRSESHPQAVLPGRAALPDLRLLIDSLSRSIKVVVTEEEPVESPKELADRLEVSIKTLARWRELGLRWRWVQISGQRFKTVVYPRRAVERFLERNADRVDRAAHFTPMDASTRERLLARARRIAQARQVTLNRVAAHLARKSGWALETVRLILEKHDRSHPRGAIFINRTGPLKRRQQRVIARAYRMGVAVRKIALRFKRTRQSIYRVIYAQRAVELRRLNIACSVLPTFGRPDAETVFLAGDEEHMLAGNSAAGAAPVRPTVDNLPDELRPLYWRTPLPEAQQHALLVRMNYLKYRARELREQLDRRQPGAGEIERIENMLAQAAKVRARLTQVNLPLVLAAGRRQLIDRQDPGGHRLLQLLEVGNRVLVEAIDGFDIGRGGTFATFLNWSLMRRFASEEGLAGKRAEGANAAGAGSRESERAQRRDNPRQVLDRMIDAAGESGIDLKLEEED